MGVGNSTKKHYSKFIFRITLVISGHVHCRKDFVFGNNKRYIINAMGYCAYGEPFKENDVKFNPNLIIDTDDL